MHNSNPLWDDIQAQPENLANVISHLYGAERPRLEAAGGFLRNDKPIVFVGMGSAAYLCMAAESYLGQYARPAYTVYASEALHNLLPSLKNVNVLINSRSGETVEIVQLSQALAEAKIPFLLITNEPTSTAAQRATHVLWSNSRQDDLVSVNIVTAMMTTTLIVMAETLGHSATLRPALEGLVDAFADTLAQAAQRADEMAELFHAARPLYVLYRGASKSAAYCSQLVLEEVARRPAVSLEAALFRQGAIEVLDEQFSALLFATGGRPGELSLALAHDIQAVGGRVCIIGEHKVAENARERLMVLPIPQVSSHFQSVLQVIPAQILAYQLAARQGYTPGTVRYLAKVITTEAGIPRQGV